MIWGARNIPQAALLKLMILYTWDGCLRESIEVPKGSQATCSVWCGSRVGYGDHVREIGLISILYCVHWAILHSCVDISVLLVLWQCCWGISGVQSIKLRPLTCLIGKTNCTGHNAGESGLIWQQGENLMGFLELRQEPRVYSPVMAEMSIRNWSLFSEVSTPV